MKIKILFISIFALLTVNLLSQWQGNVRLTYNSGQSFTSHPNGRSICANGEIVHIVWDNGDIFYMRSTNSGADWQPEIRLTENISNPTAPSIFSAGENIHIVWYGEINGNAEIFYKKSSDSGLSWGAILRLSTTSLSSYNPSIFASQSNGNIYVVWHDVIPADYSEVYFKCSTDYGATWSEDVKLSRFSGSMPNPSVSGSGDNVHVTWGDTRDGNSEIYYRRSTNCGTSWEGNIRLTNDPFHTAPACIIALGSNVHIVWHDRSVGSFNDELFYKRSTDSGNSWSANIRLTNFAGASESPNLYADGSMLHLVWVDSRFGNPEILYKYSADEGLNWGSDTRLTWSAATSDRPFVSTGGQKVHVVWHDYRDGNAEIYYIHELTGNMVGVSASSTETPESYSLSQNYPNPFNPTTNFEFRISEFGFVNLTIYDVMGKEVETIVNGNLKPGTYKADWNASSFTSGVYFYKLSAGNYTETKRMVLIK